MGKLHFTHTHELYLLFKYDLKKQFKNFMCIVVTTILLSNHIHSQCNVSPKTIEGSVVNDKDYNGAISNADIALKNISVKLYNNSGTLIDQQSSDINGKFKFIGLTDGESYRLEVVRPYSYDYTRQGKDFKSEVRFIRSPACGVNFGFFQVQNFINSPNPPVAITCFVGGKSNEFLNLETVVYQDYFFNGGSAVNKLATKQNTGSVWGLAYKRTTRELFTSSFVKYGATLGTAGIGGIYVIDRNTGLTREFIRLQDYGINLGSITASASSCDYSDYVGKYGLGDMEISPDENYLYVSNLFNKSIVFVPTNNHDQNSIFEIKVPDPGCNAGNYAISALKSYNGSIYVGVTCTAETSKKNADFAFHVYEFNILSRTFNLVFSTSFGKDHWINDVSQDKLLISQWLTDLEFTDQGNMILGIADRKGHAYCDPIDPLVNQSGNILMVWNDNGVWRLEKDGRAGSLTGSAVGTSYDGPGAGEFFGDDYWIIGPNLHSEVSFGSLAYLPGSNQILSSVFDPLYESFSGGIHRYSTLNGKRTSSIQLYNRTNSSFGKSSGLGAMAIMDEPASIEIGNYVWFDKNNNGNQDANEIGLANIPICLYDSKCHLIATTITDKNGEYSFNSNNVSGGLKYNTQYIVAIKPNGYDKLLNIFIENKDTLTVAKSNIVQDNIDSDGYLMHDVNCVELDGYPVINVITGPPGKNDYTFDIAFTNSRETDVTPPPSPTYYDIALIKKLDVSKPIRVNEPIRYEIKVYNQGTKPIGSYDLVDYIPAGLKFDPTLNPGWTIKNNIAKISVKELLEINTCKSIFINLILLPNASANQLINASEVSTIRDIQGVNVDDVDSVPDELESNDKGGQPNTVTDNVIDDNLIDEDDHDRESLTVYDLALFKTVSVNSIKVGDLVDFEIHVVNQGNSTIGTYDIVDYIPSGLSFDPVANPNWILTGNIASKKIFQKIQPQESHVEIIKLRVNQNASDAISRTNYAEISEMRDINNNIVMDSDSKPDRNPVNDIGGVPGTPQDNVIDADNTIDEDDHDGAVLPVVDMALIITTDRIIPVKVNDVVDFKIELQNQGTQSIACVDIVDYIPAGYKFIVAQNPTWTIDKNNIAKTTINKEILPGEKVNLIIKLEVISGDPNLLINRAEIASIKDKNKNELSDWDSKQDNISGNDAGGVLNSLFDNAFNGNGINDEDDEDPAAVPVLDLALILLNPTTTPVKLGQSITQTIHVCNQGNVTASNIEIIDFIPAGLVISNQDNNGWMLKNGNLVNILSGDLLPGACIDIKLILTVADGQSKSDYANKAEICSVKNSNGLEIGFYDYDSTPDKISTNDAGGVVLSATDDILNGDGVIDEDDSDPAIVCIADLALRKTLKANTILKYQGEITFLIEVFNQGNIALKNIEINDYISAGFTLSSNSITNGWKTTNYGAIYKINSTIAVGQSIIVPITLIGKSDLKIEDLINTAEINSFTNESNIDISAFDFDSAPDFNPANDKGSELGETTDNQIDDHGQVDEDDEDIADIPLYDLAVCNTLKDKNVFISSKDTTVMYIDIYNQGNRNIGEVSIIDYIDTNFIFNPTYNPNWKIGPNSSITYVLNRLIKPGESARVSVVFLFKPKRNGTIIRNAVEIFEFKDENGNILNDYDSNPDLNPDNDNYVASTNNGCMILGHGDLDEDDNDKVVTNPDNFDLALFKEVATRVVERGQLVPWTIKIINQGTVTATEITLVDYLPEGVTMVDPDWKVNPTNPNPRKVYLVLNEKNGRLPQGGLKFKDTLLVKIQTRIDVSRNAGAIVNAAEIYSAKNDFGVPDEDSKPDDIENNDDGGSVFEDTDRSGSADIGDLDQDEDDADPAGVFLLELKNDSCVCLGNATNQYNGQFATHFTLQSRSDEVWKVYSQTGLYDPSSPAPPSSPTALMVGSVLIPDIINGPVSIYTLNAKHISGQAFSIVLQNNYGDKINLNNKKCTYDLPKLKDAKNVVCSGDALKYIAEYKSGSTYNWSLSSGGIFVGSPNSPTTTIRWTGLPGTTHTLTLREIDPNKCIAPIEIPVTITDPTSEQISCIGKLNVSLDFNCQAIITPKMLLVGGPYDYSAYNVMLLDKLNNFIPNATITRNYLGQKITAKIINACDGNSCWTEVLVEDKLKPTIACINDTIDCFKLDSYLGPDVRDNCDDDPEKRFIDFRIVSPDCDPNFAKIITRKYVAIDNYGTMSDTCVMKVYLKHIALDSIIYPDSFSVASLNPLICNRFLADTLGHPKVSVTGVPMYHGRPLFPLEDHGYCNVKVWYEDFEDKSIKHCGKKIIRNWNVFRWYCNIYEKKVYQQLIEVIDTVAPTIMCPYPIEATTAGGYKCEANVFIPAPITYDSCINEVTVDLTYPGGFIKNFKGGYVTLPAGYDTLRFRAYDRCYNYDTCSFIVHVKDNTPPVAQCDRETAVSLDRFGEAWVPARVFDDGSYDDCHIKSMKVRRMDNGVPCNYSSTEFADTVGFCCADAGRLVTVLFQVTDFEGNSNTCMVQVEVQDKTIPTLYCPHDITLSCEYHIDKDSLHLFGFPTYSDNCNVTMTEIDSFHITQCRTGYIDRYFIASNTFGSNVCRQRITIINDHHFEAEDINWPDDFDTTTCASSALDPKLLRAEIGYPIINEDFCDLSGISYEDHLFRFVSGSDACFKIIRKWKIINWCHFYDQQGNPIIYEHSQIIKVNNKIDPIIRTGCVDQKFFTADSSCIGGNATLVSTADDDCTPTDQLIWHYYIDLNSDGSFDKTNFGVGGRIDASGFYPIGKHRVIYEYEDQCGNKAVCNTGLEIINNKAPIAYCRYGLAASLVAMDMDNNGKIDNELVTIWAKDFDQGSYHPCGYKLTYSFGRDTTIKSQTYNCDSIGRREVTLCVTATNGQQACCNTFIDIQDNNDVDYCNCVRFPNNITISSCNGNYDPVVINSRPTLDQCKSCTLINIEYKDSLIYGIPNVCFTVLRRWTVNLNCPGEPFRSIEHLQRLTITTDLKRSDITWPKDTVIIDNCVGNLDTIEVPHVLCGYNGNVMVMNSDRELPRTPECRFFERTWTVFSKCVPSQRFTFVGIVKLFNAGGLRYTVPSDVNIEDCRKSLLPDSLNGFPRINCPCPIVRHSFRDSTVSGLPNTCYVIFRKWTSVYNCPPNVIGTFTGTQRIIVAVQLRAGDIMWPRDTVLVDNCSGSVDTSLIKNIPKLLRDFCGYVKITFRDSTLNTNDTCRWIRRTWTVSNDCTIGAAKQEFRRNQFLKVLYPNGPRVNFPADITVTDCRKPLLPDSLNGFPKSLCPCDSVFISFRNDTVRTNPEVCYVVNRTWSVRVRCRPIVDRTVTGVQRITVDVDLTPADIIWPQDTFKSYTCNPTLDPNITGRPSLRKNYCGLISFVFADTLVSGGECRMFRRTWTAINACSASQRPRFNQFLVLRNQTPPSIQCPANRTVNSDPNTCGAVVILPNPSQTNNCNTGVTYTRSKRDSLFTVGTTPVIFTARDSCNNVATCTTLVTVIETIPPMIFCPKDTTVPCSVNTANLSQFGTATATDNCPGVVITDSVARFQNICGIGRIDRYFRATDASGNRATCKQTITINNPNPLDSIDINWPDSAFVAECDVLDPNITGIPTVDPNVTCVKLRLTYVDSNFCKSRPRCETDRKWTVFDSCSNRMFMYIQTIVIDDNNPPTIVGFKDTIIVTANQDSCNNFVSIIASISDCDSSVVLVTNNSPYGADDFRNASGTYPVGVTQFQFTALDKCCNVASRTVTVIVRDTIAPEFTCRKLIRPIKDNGCADFIAKDFAIALSDNCSNYADIMASYDKNDFTDTIITLCCDTLTGLHERTIPVKVFFKDEAGNIDSCSTLLQVVDEDSICMGTVLFANVNGLIKSRKNVDMIGVKVALNSASPLYALSNQFGFYAFDRMPLGGAYTVRPEHDVDHLNGVSTADILQIQKHILGTAEFKDPLKFIAADVNNSKSISAADISEIRKLILGKIDRFPKTNSWRFIQKDYPFINPLEPLIEDWNKDFVISILDRNYYANYVGIKMGDVDDSNKPNGFNATASRSNKFYRVSVDDIDMTAGNEYKVTIDIPNYRELDGLQAALYVDPNYAHIIRYELNEGNVLNDVHIGDRMMKDGVLLSSWINESKAAEHCSITLLLHASANISLSKVMSFNQNVLVSEVYTKDNESELLMIEYFNANEANNGLKLFQNIPNPFNVSTTIPFELTYDADVHLKITDMTGRVIFTNKNHYLKGYHEIEVNKKLFSKSGIYYYHLQTNQDNVYRRMLLID